MTPKKPKPKKRNAKQPRQKKPLPSLEFGMLPPQESLQLSILARASFPPPENPKHFAQDLMYQAWETADEATRIALALKALSTWPDCADAYCLLAEEASFALDDSMEYYRRGMEAGERAIGAKNFSEWRGDFWYVLETRPYMRAREGYANCLLLLGRAEEGVAHLLEMIELHPDDSQGLRFILWKWLIMMNRDEECLKLLEQYGDETPVEWWYAMALLAFRREGDGDESQYWLRKAMKVNTYVPEYLIRGGLTLDDVPEYIDFGEPSEAVSYCLGHCLLWEDTPNAIHWLKDIYQQFMRV